MPSSVQCSVMSVSHSWFGRVGGEDPPHQVVVRRRPGLGALAAAASCRTPTTSRCRGSAATPCGQTRLAGRGGPHRRGTGSRTRGRRDGRRRSRWPGAPRPARQSVTGSVEPPVVGLAGELEDPARHRDGDPVGGQLADERVHHFPGRFACDRYAAARRSTSFSCSSSRIRRFASRSSAFSAAVVPGLMPSSTSAALQPVRQTRLGDPEVRGDVLDPARRARGSRATRITSSRNSGDRAWAW